MLKVSASRKNALTIYLGHAKAKTLTPFQYFSLCFDRLISKTSFH